MKNQEQMQYNISKQQFLSGMRTLSKSREDELKNILLGNELFNTRI